MLNEKKEGGKSLSLEDLEKLIEKHELHMVHEKFLARIVSIIIAGLGLVAVLAWDDVLKDLFQIIFGDNSNFGQKLTYAVIVTFIATLISIILGKKVVKGTKKKK